jgi:putative transposase
MQKGRIAAGAFILLDGKPYRISHRTKLGGWAVINRETHQVETYAERQLYDFYAFGKLKLEKIDDDAQPAQAATPSYESNIARAQGDYSPQEQNRIVFWHTLIVQVERRVGYGYANTPFEVDGVQHSRLELALAEVSRDLGRDRPVSRSSYYYWKGQLDITGDTGVLAGKMRDRGRKPNLELRNIIKKEFKRAMREANALANHPPAQKKGKKPGYSVKAVRTATGNILTELKQTMPGLSWKLPALSTFYEIEGDFSEFDRKVARVGKTKARNIYRAVYGRAPVEGIHRETEYDETTMPMFLFDDVSGVPLGRGTLSWDVDVFANMPCGIYVGFEPASDLTLVSALRHACVPKTYVNQVWPDIENTYLPCGIPNLITLDNQLAQHSDTTRHLAANLQTTIRFAPPRTPWFKASVEAMFEVLNRCLLSELPGFVLSHDIDRKDYNPQTMGCIGLFHFLYIFHKWLVDVYCQTPQGPHDLSPQQLYLDAAESWAPDMLGSVDDYDRVFGLLRKARRYDHRGILFEGIWYYSDDLNLFRRLRGDHGDCSVLINPNDLSSILVWEPREKFWLRVWANRFYAKYAAGLSLHRHKLNQKYMRHKLSEDNAAALMRAQGELQNLISNALQDAMSIRQSVKLARALGIGTQNILDNIDPTGQLGPLTGVFAGRSPNPFLKAEPAVNVAQAPVDRARTRPRSENKATRIAGERDPALVEFVSDDSLKDL